MGITTETAGTRLKGEYESLAEACEVLMQLLGEYPEGFFTMSDQGRGSDRKFLFTYFPDGVSA